MTDYLHKNSDHLLSWLNSHVETCIDVDDFIQDLGNRNDPAGPAEFVFPADETLSGSPEVLHYTVSYSSGRKVLVF